MSYKLLIMNGVNSLDFREFFIFFWPVIRHIALNPVSLNNS